MKEEKIKKNLAAGKKIYGQIKSKAVKKNPSVLVTTLCDIFEVIDDFCKELEEPDED